ncbi:hypothetical protein CVT26_005068 [Gymnopilus dilepis]|uniref:Uncharacterized protein n=1 Tax=Gymnopilus dilepis TaxID=231916 RepID=A0A409Y0B6_9AGAR|nr:hypothetical protein CVT26_005068 [Gymnopilus dilepis]
MAQQNRKEIGIDRCDRRTGDRAQRNKSATVKITRLSTQKKEHPQPVVLRQMQRAPAPLASYPDHSNTRPNKKSKRKNKRPKTPNRTKKTNNYSLDLNSLPFLANRLSDILDLDDRVRLDDPQEVLFQEGVVQRGEVRPDRRVGGELCGGATRSVMMLAIRKSRRRKMKEREEREEREEERETSQRACVLRLRRAGTSLVKEIERGVQESCLDKGEGDAQVKPNQRSIEEIKEKKMKLQNQKPKPNQTQEKFDQSKVHKEPGVHHDMQDQPRRVQRGKKTRLSGREAGPLPSATAQRPNRKKS